MARRTLAPVDVTSSSAQEDALNALIQRLGPTVLDPTTIETALTKLDPTVIGRTPPTTIDPTVVETALKTLDPTTIERTPLPTLDPTVVETPLPTLDPTVIGTAVQALDPVVVETAARTAVGPGAAGPLPPPASSAQPSSQSNVGDNELLARLARGELPGADGNVPDKQQQSAGGRPSWQAPSEFSSRAAEKEKPPPPRMSREQMLLASLSRPTTNEGVLAALFDGLLGGKRHSDALAARRNQFDTALLAAQGADASGAERVAENEAARVIDREQMGVTRRGQDESSEQRTEDRLLRERMDEERREQALILLAQKESGAMARVKASRHGGGGAGGGGGGGPSLKPEEKATAIRNAEATYVANMGSTFGKDTISHKQALEFMDGTLDPETVTPEQLEQMTKGKASLDGMKVIDKKAYAQLLKSDATRESGYGDAAGRTLFVKSNDPGTLLKVSNELTKRHHALNAASKAWVGMSEAGRKLMATVGPGQWQSLALSGEDQKHAASIQALANFDIKQAAGSAVTENEWRRVAQEIGLPDAFSPFKTTDALKHWLSKHQQLYTKLEGNAFAVYPNLHLEGAE